MKYLHYNYINELYLQTDYKLINIHLNQIQQKQ